MKKLLLIDHVIIVLFALQSGIFKVAFGQADVAVFAHLGMSATLTAVFGALQAFAGLVTIPAATRSYGALALTACNAFASAALFVSGQSTLGAVSVIFVAMALLVLKRVPTAGASALAGNREGA